MDVADQIIKALLDGADQGAANVVTLGTNAAAAALWRRIKDHLRRRGKSLAPEQEALLSAEPGEKIDLAALRKAVRLLPPAILTSIMTDSHDYVAGDNVQGDKIMGDKIAGDKVMGNVYRNSGVATYGGTTNISGSAIGSNATVFTGPQPAPARRHPSARQAGRWDVGVITVLSEETSAVTAMLKNLRHYREQTSDNGLRFHEAEFESGGKAVTVVATQALDRGQQPSAVAFQHLQSHYAPVTVALVGIAGGIHPDLRLGDVVITQQVIYYDHRKEAPEHIFHRGQARPVPAVTRRAINAFFSAHGEPYQVTAEDPDGAVRTWHAMPGPVGSGEAVIASKNSEIREYVRQFNDKTLALETEAAGLAEAFYETADTAFPGAGWLSVRGISDHADAEKDDSYHHIASWHAAAIFTQLLPYLKPYGSIQD
jgi:adenosylhomocysteine nucleosidase